MKDWHHETIVENQKSPRLFHEASLSSGTAENRAVYLGLKNKCAAHFKVFVMIKNNNRM